MILKTMLNKAPLDETFYALADGTRRAMMERLARGPATVTDLARPFEMSLPAIMQHLRVLKNAGLVVSEKSGRVRTCRLALTPLNRAEDWLNAQISEWQSRLDRLETYLKDLQTKGDDHEPNG